MKLFYFAYKITNEPCDIWKYPLLRAQGMFIRTPGTPHKDMEKNKIPSQLESATPEKKLSSVRGFLKKRQKRGKEKT